MNTTRQLVSSDLNIKGRGERGDPDSGMRWCRILSIDRLDELCFAAIVVSRAAFLVSPCSLLPFVWQVGKHAPGDQI